MVTNDSKEQTQWEFRLKLKEADCHPRVTKPYSPWQQAAEGCIRELTLSFPTMCLLCISTLAIHISPNNGSIELLPYKKNDCSCVGNSFYTLNYVSWTIIDETTVPLSKGVVGLLVG
jgi:hypothetical protein